MESAEIKQTRGKYVLEIVKAVIIAVLLSLILVLLAALVIKLFNLPTNAIPIINQVVKGASVLVACLICLKIKGNYWLRGIIVGLIYIMVAFVVFSLLDGNFSIDLTLLNDVAIGGVTGLLSGIIAANIRK